MVAFEAAVGGRHPDHQGAARGPHGEPHRVDRRHHQRHLELHPLRDARQGRCRSTTVLEGRAARGYAEADPTFDIEGIDAAHKLTIMSAIAFGIPMQFDEAYTEGISKLTREDIRYAEELGYRIKLLGITQARAEGHRAARASDAGPGAAPDRQRRRRDERDPGEGRRGRADALLRRRRRRRADGERGGRRPGRRHAHASPPIPSIACRTSRSSPTSSPTTRSCRSARSRPRYYLRMRVLDKPGVLADITRILADLDDLDRRDGAEGAGRGRGPASTSSCSRTSRSRRTSTRRSRKIESAADACAGKVDAHPAGSSCCSALRQHPRRGATPQRFTEILLEGLAPDGGLVRARGFPRSCRARGAARLSYPAARVRDPVALHRRRARTLRRDRRADLHARRSSAATRSRR